jgi:hypothetical protein
MLTSSNEARGLLRKWQEEKRIIQCSMADGKGSSCGIVGRIENLDEKSVLIDARSIYPRGKFIGVTIYFHGARFSFQDSREASEEDIEALRKTFDSFLFFKFPTGCRFGLFVAR